MRKIYFIIISFFFLLFMIPSVYATELLTVSDARIVEQSGTVDVEPISYQDDTVRSNIVFNTEHDFITYEVEISNQNSSDVEIISIDSNSMKDYLDVDFLDFTSPFYIAAGSRRRLRFKILYKNPVTNQEDITVRDFKITINGEDTVIPTNPYTSNYTVLLILLVIVITILMVMYIAGDSITHKKIISGFLLLTILVPFGVVAKRTYQVFLVSDNIVLKSKMIPYNVIIYNGNGDAITRIIPFGNVVGELPTPIKEGYRFTKYVDVNNEEVYPDTIVEGNMKLYPQFEAISYSITYDLNYGFLNTPNPSSYTIEDEFVLNNPSRVGYNFSGWSEEDNSTLVTQMTIFKGTLGDKHFVANYSPNQNTEYTVIHRQQDINGNYVVKDTETLYGTTDSSVTPQRKNYEGFEQPAAQTKTINGDGSTVFTYDYPRSRYSFSVTDRSYVVDGSTANGVYYYGTQISVSVSPPAGYSIRWNDGSVSNEKTFVLTEDTVLTPTLVPNIHTQYKVVYLQQAYQDNIYYIYAYNYFYAQTDSQVTPARNTYEGFETPSAQTITVAGDGSSVVYYFYDRKKYHFKLWLEYSAEFELYENYDVGKDIYKRVKVGNSYQLVPIESTSSFATSNSKRTFYDNSFEEEVYYGTRFSLLDYNFKYYQEINYNDHSDYSTYYYYNDFHNYYNSYGIHDDSYLKFYTYEPIATPTYPEEPTASYSTPSYSSSSWWGE